MRLSPGAAGTEAGPAQPSHATPSQEAGELYNSTGCCSAQCRAEGSRHSPPEREGEEQLSRRARLASVCRIRRKAGVKAGWRTEIDAVDEPSLQGPGPLVSVSPVQPLRPRRPGSNEMCDEEFLFLRSPSSPKGSRRRVRAMFVCPSCGWHGGWRHGWRLQARPRAGAHHGPVRGTRIWQLRRAQLWS